MLIDLLSMSNYVSYNVKLANILGLNTAIYISELLNIKDKAMHKNKVRGEYFTVDRKYIQERTTLDEPTQLALEENLLSLGILEKTQGNDNDLSLNVTALTSILMSQDETLLKDISKIVKAKSSPKRTKSQVIRDNLKENIVTTNEELREAYSEWIDSVYAKEGWMSKKAVVSAQAVKVSADSRKINKKLVRTVQQYIADGAPVVKDYEDFKACMKDLPGKHSLQLCLDLEGI